MKKVIITALMLLWGITLTIASNYYYCDDHVRIIYDDGSGCYLVQKEEDCDKWKDIEKFNTYEQAQDYIDKMGCE